MSIPTALYAETSRARPPYPASSRRRARSAIAALAANLMAFKAAALHDAGRECGAEANAAKYLGGEAGFRACEAAVLTHGGMGYAK